MCEVCSDKLPINPLQNSFSFELITYCYTTSGISVPRRVSWICIMGVKCVLCLICKNVYLEDIKSTCCFLSHFYFLHVEEPRILQMIYFSAY